MAVQARRIESVIAGRSVPRIPLIPELSSATINWTGMLLEQHRVGRPFSIEMPEHYSSKHLLHFYVGQRAISEWRIEGKPRRVEDSTESVTILPAGIRTAVNVKGKTAGVVLELDPTHVANVLADAVPANQLELTPQWAVSDHQITLLITALKEDVAGGFPAGRLYGESLGNALTTYLVQRYSSLSPSLQLYKGGLSASHLNHVLDYIEQRLVENLGLSDLAAITGLSIYHFARQFRQSTGVSPYQYVLQRKIERAKQFLLDPKKSVLEASARTGFVDQSHFTKVFRRLVGVTPTEFRART